MKNVIFNTVFFLASFIVYWFFLMVFIPVPRAIVEDSRITVGISSVISIFLTIITLWAINQFGKLIKIMFLIILVILATVIVYLILTI